MQAEATLEGALQEKPQAPSRISARTIGLGLLAAAAVLTIPSAGYGLTPGGEYEYQAALTVAFRDHLQWGKDVLWTYGPLGYMDVPAYMDFRTWFLGLAANLVAHAALFGVLALFLVRIRARAWLWILTAVLVVAFFERYQGFDFERFPVLDHKEAIVAALLLYLAYESRGGKEPALFAGAAGIVIGFLLLGKGTALVTAGGLIAAYAAISLVRRDVVSFGALIGGLVIGFAGGWLAIDQSLADIPAYLRSSYEAIAGYTAAESWFSEAPIAHPEIAIVLGAAVFLAALLVLIAALWRRDRAVAALQLLTLPILLTSYKNSFVRFDEPHALTFWSLAAVMEGLVLVRALSQAGRWSLSMPTLVTTGAVAVCALLVVGGIAPLIGNTPQIRPVFLFTDNLASYRHAAGLVLKPAHRGEETDQVNAVLRSYYPLPDDVISELRRGTVDVVPWDPQLAIAYGFNWKQQPVLLSYVAASRPYLDEKNAEFYTGSDAPEFVLLNAHQLDDRYPLFDEPQAYRALFANYELRTELPDWLVLQKRAVPATGSDIPLGSATARLGDWVAVPPGRENPVYGRVHVNYTAFGNALNVIDRPPELHIRFQLSDGEISASYRFIPATGSDGLFLSSYAIDIPSYADVLQGIYAQPIDAIQITANSPASAYQQAFQVDYFASPR